MDISSIIQFKECLMSLYAYWLDGRLIIVLEHPQGKPEAARAEARVNLIERNSSNEKRKEMMKYKFLIVMGLMVVGFSILSCNQIGKALQAVDTITDEESSEEEKWDSIVISYHKDYKYANYSKTGSMIMYSDGTAKHGRNHGYWNYGSF